MNLLKMIIKLIKNRYTFIAIGGVIIILFFLNWNKFVSIKLKSRNNGLIIKEIKNISELVTAEYYGEVICSLKEVYKNTHEKDVENWYVFVHYELNRDSVNKRNSINRALKKYKDNKIYILLKDISGINRDKLFLQYIKDNNWAQFIEKHKNQLNNQLNNLTSGELKNADAVYIGRGTVHAGFDLSEISSQNISFKDDTLFISGIDPVIFDIDINPWFIPEKEVPGFELIYTKKERKISFEQIGLIKKTSKHKLYERAVDNGIYDKAVASAEEYLLPLFSILYNKELSSIKIIPTGFFNIYIELSKDAEISIDELNLIKQSISGTPYNLVKAFIYNIDNTCTQDDPEAWNDLKAQLLSFQGEKVVTSAPSVHKEHLEANKSLNYNSEEEWDKHHGIVYTSTHSLKIERDENYKIIGFHPYFCGSSYKCYNFNLLWGVAYFSYELNPHTGEPTSVHQWETTGLVDSAKRAGCKVFLTVNNFGYTNNLAFLSNQKAQDVFIKNLVSLVNKRGADGVTIDFEELPVKAADLFSGFIEKVKSALIKEDKNNLALVCLPAVDWANAFNIDKLKSNVDYFIVMGYDYYYSSSKQAGPVSPLSSGDEWLPYNLEKTVTHYLDKGFSSSGLILALPYYGREWKTSDKNYPSENLGYLESPAYRKIPREWIENAMLDNSSNSKMYTYKDNNGNYRQVWFVDSLTLSTNYQWIKKKQLAGVGIWALGYDNGRAELWNALNKEFGK